MIERRILYCVPGAWTDAWWDDPGAWWQWITVFRQWPIERWHAFYGRWRTAPEAKRRELMETTGNWFFDWRRVDGGSLWGSARTGARLIAEDLAQLPSDVDLTLIGHSKGGLAVKHVLATQRAAASGRTGGPPPARAIFVDAPLDRLREWVGRLLQLKTESCRLDGSCGVPMATINNWLDPSGGRLKGVPNYQTFVWQDYLEPYPPHGMKGFLAARVLRDLGALPSAPTEDIPGAGAAGDRAGRWELGQGREAR